MQRSQAKHLQSSAELGVSATQSRWVVQWGVGGDVIAQSLDDKRKAGSVVSSSFLEKQVPMAKGDWNVNGDQQISTMKCLWYAKNMM